MGRQFQPFDLGQKFRVWPADTPPPPCDRFPLIMAPGAFGSGEHETTRSCIEQLEALPSLKGMRVLDLGSGTAILAIAAIRLGAEKVLCVDIDPAATATGRLNARLNGMENTLEFLTGTLEDVPSAPFDLILANIYGDILLDVARELCALARPGCRLLLSGILWEYNYEVRAEYARHGCTLERNLMLEEFSSVVLRKT